MKRLIKNGFSLGLVLLGRINPNLGIPILTYHSVDSSGSVISVSEDVFVDHMKYLSDHGYKTISLRMFLSQMKGDVSYDGNNRKKVVLTFDDGYKNNYTIVFPVLKRFGFTATFFLTTGYIGKECLWNKIPSLGYLPLLSWEEIKEMSKAGMEFGAHTIRHVDLSAVTGKDAEEEIRGSREAIEDRLNKPVDFFCYPYGRFTRQTESIVKKLGFLGGCSIHYGINNRKQDQYRLKRIGTARFSSLLDYQAGILGTYGAYVYLSGLMKGIR